MPLLLFSQQSGFWYPKNKIQASLIDSAFSPLNKREFIIYYRNNSTCNACQLFVENLPINIKTELLFYSPEQNTITNVKDSIICSVEQLKSAFNLILGSNAVDHIIKVNIDLRIVKITPFFENRNYKTIQNLMDNHLELLKPNITVDKKIVFTSAIVTQEKLVALAVDGQIYAKLKDSIRTFKSIYKTPSYNTFIDILPLEVSKHLIRDDNAIKSYINNPVHVVHLFGADTLPSIVYQVDGIEKHGDTLTEMSFYFVEFHSSTLGSKIYLIDDVNKSSYFRVIPMIYSESEKHNMFIMGNYEVIRKTKGKFPLFTKYKRSNTNKLRSKPIRYIPIRTLQSIQRQTGGFLQIHKLLNDVVFYEYGGVILTKNNKIVVPLIIQSILNSTDYKFCKLKSVTRGANGYKTVYAIGYTLIEIDYDESFQVVSLNCTNMYPFWDPSYIYNNLLFLGTDQLIRLGKYHTFN